MGLLHELTREEKNQYIADWCEGMNCEDCPLDEVVDNEAPCHGEGANVSRNYARLKSSLMSTEFRENNDVVNHPSHYCREGAMESIDEMLLIFGAEAVKGFCLCNAWKYRYRASAKNGDEDLRKSDWYIAKYKELCGE